MTSFSNLRARLVGTVFIAITPAWILMYYTRLPWTGFIVGLLALTAAWFGGERFILRQVRLLLAATERLAKGDLASRTGLGHEQGELGDLARQIDTMAENLEQRVLDRERTEHTLLSRSLQQTVVSALGQFALVSSDFAALLDQAVLLTGQTLEVEYCGVFQLSPNGRTMVLKAGLGWKDDLVGRLEETAEVAYLPGYSLRAGDPVVVENLARERRFEPGTVLSQIGAVSCISVAVPRTHQPFGILCALTTHPRQFSEDEIQFVLSVATVIATAVERAQSQAQLEKLAAFARLNPNPAMEVDVDGRLTYANPAAVDFAKRLGLDAPQGLLPAEIAELASGCLRTGQSKTRHETRLAGRTLSWSLHPVQASQVVHVYMEDITERLSLEQQLRQSQKMESIGQLAAGVAHDFNNMLTVIQGHAGMLLARPSLPDETRAAAQAIAYAAERAAGFTRQLLMFSRKNIMQPKLLDLRQVISQMAKLLQRLVGETVELRLDCGEAMPFVLADIGMIEQILMNLVVNARDAMPKGGTVTIGVRPVEVGEEYTRTRADASPGSYARLYVEDTGTGMDPATVKRIFEPFFTTKEVGKGTGLGLATVYGIVKQHQGWIDVTSQLGTGSRFDIYLPASDQPAPEAKADRDAALLARPGNETIPVVEDEPTLRELASGILERSGYRVILAGSGPEALRVWEKHQDQIDLVLTDMVMPEGMSGMDLAQQLRAARPGLKVIVASGYSMEESETVFFSKGVQYLQKPYTHVTLTKAIRESLEAGKS